MSEECPSCLGWQRDYHKKEKEIADLKAKLAEAEQALERARAETWREAAKMLREECWNDTFSRAVIKDVAEKWANLLEARAKATTEER